MDFKLWLEQIGLGVPPKFIVGGKLKLYHYSQRLSDEEVVLDPKNFIENRNYFSSNDYKMWPVPRTFFYLDVREAETLFKNQNLYVAEVSSDKIYNLIEDPLGYKKKFSPDITAALNAVYEDLFETGKIIGVYYKPDFHCVNLLIPVKAIRVQPNDAAALMTQTDIV